jgi:prolyl oligopeptidase
MRRLYSAFILSACAGALVLNSCTSNVQSTTVSYPETEKIPVVDTYFEEEVVDNYRWLEDDRSAATEDWVKRQNETTFSHLNGISYKEELKARLEKLWNYEKISRPFKEGAYTYFYKNDGLQNQSVVYRQKGENEEADVFLDPNSFSEDGTVSLAGLSFTEDGSLLAYSISEGGSDWRKIIVLDAETKEQVGDTIIDVKFSGISWKKNEGFYYSSYDKPDGSELSAKTDQHKLYFHRLGTSQEEDQLIYGGTADEKHRYIGGSVSEDARFLFISASNTTSGNKLFMQDLSVENAPIFAIVYYETSYTYVS